MIDAITKITLYVEDQEKAKAFWTEKLGFIIKLEQQMGPDMKWLEVAPKNESSTAFVLYNKKMMQKQNPDTNVGHPSVILSTHDIQKAYDVMKEKGVKVGDIMKMPYGSMFQFFDMEGNIFLLREDN